MQPRMGLVLPVAVLLIACGAAPSGTPSRLRNLTAAATNGPPLRLGSQPNGSVWTINSPIPEPLGVAQGATVASGDGSRIYHIGGITGARTPTNKVRVYLPSDDTWYAAADIPVSPGIRTFGAAVELNGFIYVFGGFDGTNILDTTWIYDEAKDTWFQGAKMSGPRFGSAVATDGAVIWVLSGFEGLSIGDENADIYRYDPRADSWFFYGYGTNLGRLHTVMLPDENLHILGGSFDG